MGTVFMPFAILHFAIRLCLRLASMFCSPVSSSPNSQNFDFDLTFDVINDLQVKVFHILFGKFTYRAIE